MKHYWSSITLIFLTAAMVRGATKPNIIFILTDDLGYGDLGVLYQNSRRADQPKMATPELDKMAREGSILTQHYSAAPVCAPARASLLLGQHQGNCAIRNNQFDKALPHNHTLGTVMKAAGYHTAMIGKYGLPGKDAEYPGHPMRRGFDEFYGVLYHNAAHFHYPGNSGKIMDGYEPVTNGLDRAYDTDLYTARAKKFIVERNTAPDKQPFFLYLAYTAPHFYHELPTQAYPVGRGTNGGLQWPLNTNNGKTNSWYYPEYATQPWPDVEKRHACMIRRVDDGVGDILQLLRDLHIDTNTLVVFTSDNGPHNEDGQDPRFFDSWGNMDGIKRDLWEAGIREPTIVRWPGHVPAGSVNNTISAFWDWMPTFCDLGGLLPPAQTDGVSLARTLTGQPDQRSRGFLYFEYDVDVKPHFPVDKEMFARKHVQGRGQMQAIRLGDFTAVRYTVAKAAEPFRLYNVVADPHEDHDLAADSKYAPLLAKAKAMCAQVRHPDPNAKRPYDHVSLAPSNVTAKENGMLAYSLYNGSWPWVPDLDASQPVSSGKAMGLDLKVLPGTEATAASFKGYIQIKTNSLYTFTMESDSGAQLWIHESHIIDDDFNHDGSPVSGSIRLQAGLHPIRIFYRHTNGAPRLTLQYEGPGIPKQPVPAGIFCLGSDQ